MPIDNSSTTILVSGLCGGGVASMIGGVFGWLNMQSVRKSEERQQIRELAVQVALENWKMAREHLKGTRFDSHPVIEEVDVYLIHAMHLVAAIDGRLKTTDQIKTHLQEGFAAINASHEELAKRQHEQLLPKKPSVQP
jgi:hypothetical protein